MKLSGKLTNASVINLPDEWVGKANPDSIVVHLTPYGVSQDLFVKTIDYAWRIEVRSQSVTAVNCFYTVEAEELSQG